MLIYFCACRIDSQFLTYIFLIMPKFYEYSISIINSTDCCLAASSSVCFCRIVSQDSVINKSLMLTNYTSGLFPIDFCANFFYRKSNLKSLKHTLWTQVLHRLLWLFFQACKKLISLWSFISIQSFWDRSFVRKDHNQLPSPFENPGKSVLSRTGLVP